MKLSVLLSVVREYRLNATMREQNKICDPEVEGLCADSRLVKKGDLFICLTGGKVDSHELIDDAVERGAIAVLAEKECAAEVPVAVVKNTRLAMSLVSSKFYGEPSKSMKVIGITGTNGKTTTSYMLAEILRAAGKKTGLIGTLGVFYGKKKLESCLTTPDPIFLQSVMADMYSQGVEYVVMEVSAHALHYNKTEGIEFAACIFTNLSQDHLDFFSSMEEYGKTKLRFFDPKRCRLAIVNADDEMSERIFRMREKFNRCGKTQTLFYGLDSPADAFAVVTDEGLWGSRFLINVNDELAEISLKIAGRHNISNALAAATCAKALGIDMEYIAVGLGALSNVKGRLERIACYQGGEIFVDFAHTPDGIEKVLRTLREHCRGRLFCLFGCGGDRDVTKREVMGARAAKLADFCILTSDNPRGEDPLKIIQDIEKGFKKGPSAYVSIVQRENAIVYALGLLKENDVLLIAGKGAENYQEIKGIKYPYNDEDFILKIVGRK